MCWLKCKRRRGQPASNIQRVSLCCRRESGQAKRYLKVRAGNGLGVVSPIIHLSVHRVEQHDALRAAVVAGHDGRRHRRWRVGRDGVGVGRVLLLQLLQCLQALLVLQVRERRVVRPDDAVVVLALCHRGDGRTAFGCVHPSVQQVVERRGGIVVVDVDVHRAQAVLLQLQVVLRLGSAHVAARTRVAAQVLTLTAAALAAFILLLFCIHLQLIWTCWNRVVVPERAKVGQKTDFR